MNVAVVAFANTVMEAGAANAGEPLLPTVTTAPPAGAAFDSVTVQTAFPLDASVVGVHCKDVTVADVCKDTVVDAVVPLNEPVSVAV